MRAASLIPELAELAPKGDRRMGANPHANGGLLLQRSAHARFPRLCGEVCTSPAPNARSHARSGQVSARRDEAQRWTRKTSACSARMKPRPTGWRRCTRSPSKIWMEPLLARRTSTFRRDGRVMEMLSEHMCQGWLEGYLLTGRHGFFSCYEAFIHIVDSMFNQHAKWLKVTRDIPWRRPIASLNYLLTSHVWRQDHNGFSHQDPGFIDHVVNKKADMVRVYLPPDANTCSRSPTTVCAAATT